MNELGNRLGDLLVSHDMSQRALADELGVSNVTISRIIRGQGNVTLNTLIAIADFFSVSLDWLGAAIGYVTCGLLTRWKDNETLYD